MPTNPRQLPHSAEAEASVLGGLIMNAEKLMVAEEHLRAEDFYDPRNQQIYQNILAMREAGQPLDLVTLTQRLTDVDLIEKIGGPAYLAALVQQVPMLSNFENYCVIVQDQALLRRLVQASSDILDDCYGEYESVADVVEAAERKIFQVGEGQIKGDFAAIGDVVGETIQHIEEVRTHRGETTGLATGFKELDFKTSGLQKSDLIYVAARPSMGKTAFALNLAQHAAVKEKASVAIFSLEMSRTQLVQRMLCSEGLIDLSKVRTGTMDNEEWRVMADAAGRLYGTKIKIDDTGGQSLADIRSKARRLKAESGLDLVLIDYLQLMTGRRGVENRQNEISEISRGLKALARELDCPIVCLSQLSRAPDGRPDHHPMLADLRESGSIEQDADIVLFLYRAYYYDKENSNPNMAELDVAKQRNGPTGRINLTWRSEFTRFMDWADESTYSDPGPAPF
ncbi:replicative DNA helicase [Pseudoramibacter alactolyticus ATCC 23263]|uniref:Replicative DNA helicase n=1 Tax=Pseudoramibacter alactolyticus ATCC 23263 TaxID=887929 RepID=E6MIK4_9FIRM|nr:replicative DNA helicase [Pseudoramibacter alactolyticus]EFV01100.1 replicative DNA helicase [Pseudoramibacter alactolyticus ATCC 23263]